MKIIGEVKRNMTAEGTLLDGRSGRLPLAYLLNHRWGNQWHRGLYRSLYPDTLLPKQPYLAPERPAWQCGADFQRSLLRVPVGRLGRSSMKKDQGVFSFHLPFRVLPILAEI